MTWECPFSGPFSGPYERILAAYSTAVSTSWQRGVEEVSGDRGFDHLATVVWRPVGLNASEPLRGDTVRASDIGAANAKSWLVHPEVDIQAVPGFRSCNTVCCIHFVDFQTDSTCTFHGGGVPRTRGDGSALPPKNANGQNCWRSGWETDQLLVGTFPSTSGDLGILYVPQRRVRTRSQEQGDAKNRRPGAALGARHGVGSAASAASAAPALRIYGDYRLVRCCWLMAPPTGHQQTTDPCVFEVQSLIDSRSSLPRCLRGVGRPLA